MSTEITPFTLHIDDAEIADLRRRLEQTRWPDEHADAGWSDGVPLAYAKELAEHWGSTFDWRAQEERLNAVPQFTTEIDGHGVHFFHVRSPRPDAKPLLLIHGWPSAPTDFFGMIPLLSEPDGEHEQAFDLVILTIPGFGISGQVDGWTLTRVADAFAELMTRLDYERFLVHGFDTGAGVARDLGLRHGDRVAAVHTTGMLGGESLTEETADMSKPDEAQAVADGYRYEFEVGAYAMVQATRPQSIAYALTDSPVAQMTWIVERFRDWSGRESPEEAFSRDEMLTVVSIYWFFRTAGSSARYYKYGLPGWDQPLTPSTVPTAILVMADDIGRPVRRLAEQTDNIVHWATAEQGGHFAGWDQPRLVADDIRASIGDLA